MGTDRSETPPPFGAYLARAYSLAVAMPDRVPGFVRDNGKYFCDECEDIRFGRYFVEQLRARALSGPSPNEVRDEAMRIAGDSGAPEMGRGLADDLMAGQTDMLRLADFLEQLIDATPSLRQGDQTRYRATGLCQMMTAAWNGAAGLMGPGRLQQIQEMAFQMNQWYVATLMEAVQVDFMAADWSRQKAQVADFVQKYRDAVARYQEGNKQEDAVQVLVNGSVVLGMVTRYAALFGRSAQDIEGLHRGLDIDPLIDFLTANHWLS